MTAEELRAIVNSSWARENYRFPDPGRPGPQMKLARGHCLGRGLCCELSLAAVPTVLTASQRLSYVKQL